MASLALAFWSLVGKVRCVRAGSGAMQPLCVQQVVQNGRRKRRPLTKRYILPRPLVFVSRTH